MSPWFVAICDVEGDRNERSNISQSCCGVSGVAMQRMWQFTSLSRNQSRMICRIESVYSLYRMNLYISRLIILEALCPAYFQIQLMQKPASYCARTYDFLFSIWTFQAPQSPLRCFFFSPLVQFVVAIRSLLELSFFLHWLELVSCDWPTLKYCKLISHNELCAMRNAVNDMFCTLRYFHNRYTHDDDWLERAHRALIVSSDAE